MRHEGASVSEVDISYDTPVEISSYYIDFLAACVLRYCAKTGMHVSEMIQLNEDVLDGCVGCVVMRIVFQTDVGRDQAAAWMIGHRHGRRC